MRTNVTLEEALAMLLKESGTIEAVHVPLLDALGSVLAENIVSDMDMPPFKKSPLDGYAVRGEDTEGASKDTPIILKVMDFVPAGYVSNKRLGKKEAMRIMTGAKIPEGADAVVKFEDTKYTEETVTVYKKYPVGTNIVKAGEDMEKGDLVLQKGEVIDAPEIGILATLGKAYVEVFRKPRVAILSTGDELVDMQQPLVEGKIRNSNSYTIAAQIKKLGAKPLMLGICSDAIEIIKAKLNSALNWADIVITTGGVSVGDHDLAKEAFREVGAEVLFWRVRMKPGTPIAVAKKEEKLIFGLSGNPAAAYITFEQFVRPIILKKMGRGNYKLMEVKSILESDFTKASNQNRFVRGNTYYRDGKYYTRLPEKHSSGVLTSLMGTNSLFYIKALTGPYKKGDEITVQLLNHPEVLK
ncbi:gephyrin-like molybdotransferase Glp [Clostridium formicaceticum]|uniref:Molybdopterin molybdenumtransferase n=1 Tax=Clostridium formicaceticum TaxID=1497 RepID=A0AAC9WH23_9CLOT|nr:gephyrin-like molybdotransferase Glp [Clostridium formicaceticum]AOY77787.1 molybdopterin molybdenumtransferase MoeA [Clostridium formicaceticum]ARE88394.1 Molybdopterin molybdenumtransferase [Clostridium formicaceticum]